MRVCFVWKGISGYMAACWRALSAMDGVDVHVIAERPAAGADAAFDVSVMDGISCDLIAQEESADSGRLVELVSAQRPEVVVMAGWGTASFARVVADPKLSSCRFIMTSDTPYRGTLRQLAGRYVKRSYFRRFDHAVVAGERAHRLLRVLGFREEQLTRGVYSVDFDGFARAGGERPRPWPRTFCFVGRYAEEKGIDVLCRAYTAYRGACVGLGGGPWELVCVGKGKFAGQIAETAGTRDLGFVQPTALPRVLAKQGAFVLASRYEPWGTVIAEAGASGLPILCSEACGAHLELVRTYFNGMVVPTGDAGALCRAMLWLHGREREAEEIGGRSVGLARAYGQRAWADRWQGVLSGVLGR